MITSIEYNGYTFQDEATLHNFTGGGLPGIRSESQPKAVQDGAVPLNFNYGARLFGWKGIMASDTVANYIALRQEIMFALNPTNVAGDEMTFTLLDGSTRTLRNVVVTEGPFEIPEEEPSRTWNSYVVTFRADFPFFEGEETVGTQQITAFDSGVVIPAPVASPLTGTVDSGSNKAALTNAGNANAYPILVITGPGTNFTITNETTGQEFRIEYTLAAGETITIDTWEKTAYKGTTNVRSSIPSDSDWICLAGGAAGQENIISFSSDSDSDTDTMLEITYKDTYLGI